MSLANRGMKPIPSGPKNGEFRRIELLYKGLKRIIREFDVDNGDQLMPSNIDLQVFDSFGTKDTETTRPEYNDGNIETGYENCYLEEQQIVGAPKEGRTPRLRQIYIEAYIDELREIEKPRVVTDENGRRETQRTFVVLNGASDALKNGTIGETADPDFPDNVLRANEITVGNAVSIIRRSYIEATDTWEQVGSDRIYRPKNNLLHVERTFIAKAGSPLPPTLVGGNPITKNTGDDNATCYLAQVDIRENEVFQTSKRTYIEAGIVSRSEDEVGSQKAVSITAWKYVPTSTDAGSGYVLARTQKSDSLGFPTNQYTFLRPSILSRSEDYVGSQKAITIEAFSETPSTPSGYELARTQESDVEGIPTKRYTFLKPGRLSFSESPGPVIGTKTKTIQYFKTDDGASPGGVLTSIREVDVNGIPTITKTYVTGTITGTKYSYNTSVRVDVPGTVECTTIVVPEGDIADVVVKAPTRKEISATVTLAISTTPPGSYNPAFNMDNISCAVTYITTRNTYQGEKVTTAGPVIIKNAIRTKISSGNSRQYPRCYLISPASAGIQSYSPDGSATNYIYTSANGTGSTTVEDYVETGIIDRRVRPAFTALDGTTYYEIITTEV